MILTVLATCSHSKFEMTRDDFLQIPRRECDKLYNIWLLS